MLHCSHQNDEMFHSSHQHDEVFHCSHQSGVVCFTVPTRMMKYFTVPTRMMKCFTVPTRMMKCFTVPTRIMKCFTVPTRGIKCFTVPTRMMESFHCSHLSGKVCFTVPTRLAKVFCGPWRASPLLWPTLCPLTSPSTSWSPSPGTPLWPAPGSWWSTMLPPATSTPSHGERWVSVWGLWLLVYHTTTGNRYPFTWGEMGNCGVYGCWSIAPPQATVTPSHGERGVIVGSMAGGLSHHHRQPLPLHMGREG